MEVEGEGEDGDDGFQLGMNTIGEMLSCSQQVPVYSISTCLQPKDNFHRGPSGLEAVPGLTNEVDVYRGQEQEEGDGSQVEHQCDDRTSLHLGEGLSSIACQKCLGTDGSKRWTILTMKHTTPTDEYEMERFMSTTLPSHLQSLSGHWPASGNS